ncbi:hypothetical protein DL96DRAFT_1616539 [Flagelloscypha sp. PMI_526]|nr:hypothetical protein DL96DRAFT_1616539 [Flagelloscypha sp. PMI_526]
MEERKVHWASAPLVSEPITGENDGDDFEYSVPATPFVRTSSLPVWDIPRPNTPSPTARHNNDMPAAVVGWDAAPHATPVVVAAPMFSPLSSEYTFPATPVIPNTSLPPVTPGLYRPSSTPPAFEMPIVDEILQPGGPLVGWDMLREDYQKYLSSSNPHMSFDLTRPCVSPPVYQVTVKRNGFPWEMELRQRTTVTVDDFLRKLLQTVQEQVDMSVLEELDEEKRRKVVMACGLRLGCVPDHCYSLLKGDFLLGHTKFQGIEFRNSGKLQFLSIS